MEKHADAQLEELLKRIEELDMQQRNLHMQLMQLKQQASQLQPQRVVATPVQKQSSTSSFSLEQFIGLKLLNLVGIIVLLIGVAIGVKFAIDKNLISPFVRIVLAYIAGGLLFGLSVFLRGKYEAFSAILFSGAMAAFYFTTYGAYDFYSLLSRPVAFGIMVLLTVFTVVTSLKYKRQEISVLALVGTYAIPFLVGGDSGNVLALFSYIFLINCGILFISFQKEWEWLKALAFGFTYVILLSWLLIDYSVKEWFGTAILFSILFFVQFLFTVNGFQWMRKREATAADNVILCFLNLFGYLSVIFCYKNNTESEVYAWITLATGLVYGLLAFLSKSLFSHSVMASRIYLVYAVLLLIIYVPIQFEDMTVSFVWIAGAVVLFVSGLIRKIRLLRLLSIILFAITLFKLVTFDSASFTTVEKIIMYLSLGALLLIVSFLYQKYKHLLFEKDA